MAQSPTELTPGRTKKKRPSSSRKRARTLAKIALRANPASVQSVKIQRIEDLKITFPEPGLIRFHSPSRFKSWNHPRSRAFIELSLSIREVQEVALDQNHHTAEVYYLQSDDLNATLKKIAEIYRGARRGDLEVSLSEELLKAIPKTLPRLRAFRHGTIISTWELRWNMPGWIRLRNPLILNKPHLAEALERELLSLLGVSHYQFHLRAGSLTVEFDPRVIHTQQIVSHLDAALCRAPKSTRRHVSDYDFSISTTSLALAAAATFFVPALLPFGTALMLYTAIPSFRRSYVGLFKEKRLGVDTLDSIIFIACLFTGQIFAGAMTAWFLSLGRKLVNQTRAESSKILLQVFGKQPTFARVLRDGREIETALEKIQRNDQIVVHTGEVVPVDGVIVVGDAILDQQALTGESTPAERTVGQKVFASTIMLAGQIVVRVEKAGKDTASSKISEVLNKTVSYKLRAQSRGEELADKAVWPALGLSALAGGLNGTSAALR